MSCWLQRLRIDPFLLVLILVVLLARFLLRRAPKVSSAI